MSSFERFTTCAGTGRAAPNEMIATAARTSVPQPENRKLGPLLLGAKCIFTLANHLADFSRERLGRERFLEQLVTWIERAVVADVVVGIAGDVKDLHVGPETAEFHSEFIAVHMRHDDVGHEKMNRSVQFP